NKGDGRSFLFTSRVTLDDLPDDHLLSLTPGIFQHEVVKRHEIRVTMMGHTLIGIKIDSNATSHGTLDWRAHPTLGLPVTAVKVSGPIADACRAIAGELGLFFGCFDFIIDQSGDPVFLEVNQMGNFL